MTLQPLNIVADENIPAIEMFESLGTITRVPGRDMSADQLRDADVLLVRSVTRVNEALLANSKVQFVGTATIGIDHLDVDYLNRRGIEWSNAPGSNANSVAEYVLSALCYFYQEGLAPLLGKKAGVVGFGNVGKVVASKLRMLGMKIEAYDPLIPMTVRNPLSSLSSVFDCDVLCVHAPLTRGTTYPSYHMIDARHWQLLRRNACLISAGRGGVIGDHEIAALHHNRPDVRMAIDVWENEPAINWALAREVDIATPHIAGYSYDGKVAGTVMIYEALCRHLNLPFPSKRRTKEAQEDIDIQGVHATKQLHTAIQHVYDLSRDSERFKAIEGDPEQRAILFDLQRKNYPERRECSHYRLVGLAGNANLRSQALGLGFTF